MRYTLAVLLLATVAAGCQSKSPKAAEVSANSAVVERLDAPPYTRATVTVYNAMPMGNDITVTGTFRTRRDFGAGYK